MTDYTELVKTLREESGSHRTNRIFDDAADAIEGLIESVHIRDKHLDELNHYIWKLETLGHLLESHMVISDSRLGVILCKDCKHRPDDSESGNEPRTNCPLWCGNCYGINDVPDDFYCKYGERRNE